jgi:fatty acid desaturase
MHNLLQIIIGMLIIGSCFSFFINIDEHPPNWSLKFIIQIILGGPIIWIAFLGGLFISIIIGLPMFLFLLLFEVTDLIFKSKEDKEDKILEIDKISKPKLNTKTLINIKDTVDW